MRLKYPQKSKKSKDSVAVGSDEEMLTPLEQMAHSFHASDSEFCLPEFCSRPTPVAPPVVASSSPPQAGTTISTATATSQQPWGLAHMRLTPGAALEASLPKRLTSLVLASLRASGTFRMFVEADGPARRDFYASLGYRVVAPIPQLALAQDGAATDQLSPSPTPSSTSSGSLGIINMTRSF